MPYSSTTIAGAALRALTATTIAYPEDPLNSRLAQPLVSHPRSQLYIRLALITDKKAPGAYNRHQPERRRRNYDSMSGDPSEPRKRARYDDDIAAQAPWVEDMYDDNNNSLAARTSRPARPQPRGRSRDRDDYGARRDWEARQADRDRWDWHDRQERRSRDASAVRAWEERLESERRRSFDEGRRYQHDTSFDLGRDFERSQSRDEMSRPKPGAREKDEDLFAKHRSARTHSDGPEQSYGRLRDRSASPLRDGDGRHGFSDADTAKQMLPPNESQSRAHRQRSSTPPRARTRKNAERDLFAEKLKPHESLLATPKAGIELFPERVTPGSKPRINAHQRMDAVDARDALSVKNKGKDLFARINGGAGRSLDERISSGFGDANGAGSRGDAGFSIRGRGAVKDADAEMENPGFSIKGLGANHKKVKDLFASRMEGEGERDLFAGRLNGGSGALRSGGLESRITGRRMAEDLF